VFTYQSSIFVMTWKILSALYKSMAVSFGHEISIAPLGRVSGATIYNTSASRAPGADGLLLSISGMSSNHV